MQNILWCPIDLPKFSNFPKFEQDLIWHFWKVSKLTINSCNPYSITEFNSNIKNNYPDLVEWFKLFPYTTIRNIILNLQIKKVNAHIDFTKPDLDPELYRNNSENEPCGYRIILSGGRKNKLYVIKNNQKVYCTMPDDTDVYVLGHTSTLHGVDDDDNRWTIFTHFEIDKLRHNELLLRSLQKYKDYAIID
jgi:hypothetical protein